MRRLFKLFLLFSTASIISCNNQKGYVITGNLTGFSDSTKFYLQNANTQEILDSALLINHKFMLRGHLNDVPENMGLHTTIGKKFIYTTLLIGNENIKIKGDAMDFPWNLKISGSATQDEFNYRLGLTKTFYTKRDSLLQSFFKLPEEIQKEKEKEVWAKIDKLDDTTHSLLVSYVRSHLNTYPGIIELGYLKNSFSKDTLKAMYNRLNPEFKSSKYARIVEVYLNDKISAIGDRYHDFEAVDKDGNQIKFSELTGKYILLDFTSVSCGPCVQSISEMKLIDKTYNDSLTVVSFSTDARKDQWLKSIKQDTISWLSLWDGKGTFSETYIKYGVDGIPAFFLISPDGKIIDKWMGYGKGSLENKLKKFKKT